MSLTKADFAPLQMSGTEQAKAKEDAAAIMRAKQLAGTFLSSSLRPFPPFSTADVLDAWRCSYCAYLVLHLLCVCLWCDADESRSRSKKGGRWRQKMSKPERQEPRSTANVSAQLGWVEHGKGVTGGSCSYCEMVF